MDVLANHQLRLLLSQNWTVLYTEYLNWRTSPPDSLSSFEWRKISKHFLAEILSTSRLDGCSGEPPALRLLLSQSWTRKIFTHGCVRITCTLCTGTQTRWGSCYKFSDRCLQKPASAVCNARDLKGSPGAELLNLYFGPRAISCGLIWSDLMQNFSDFPIGLLVKVELRRPNKETVLIIWSTYQTIKPP